MSKTQKPFSPSENHSYNVNVATALKRNTGKATLLKEFYRSYRHWKANDNSFRDGFHWFFLKMTALEELYPEFTAASMYRWLKELEEESLIASRDDLNKHGYDRTKWFTVNEFAYESLSAGKTLAWLNSQNENSENIEFSNWKTAIIKMRNAILKMMNSNSQNDTTIQPCLNPCEEPCLNPKSETGVSLSLSKTDLQEDFDKKEEKNSGQKEEKQRMIEDAISLIGVLNAFAGRSLPCDPDGRGSNNVDYVVSLLSQKIKGKHLYSFENVELVIQYKCFEWMNTKEQKYLRPSTLFGSKFSKYLDDAEEAKDNPAFLNAVKKAKQSEEKANGHNNLSTAGAITHGVANRLQNW
jgi:uncharacterized phage protein (TIGR02220 family)